MGMEDAQPKSCTSKANGVVVPAEDRIHREPPRYRVTANIHVAICSFLFFNRKSKQTAFHLHYLVRPEA